MPIYEYRCEKCEEEFEVSQRITDAPLTEHEGCGGPVRRLISRTSFTLKGSGWYSDHYGLKPGASKGSASSSSSSASSAPASGSKSSDGASNASTPSSSSKAKAE